MNKFNYQTIQSQKEHETTSVQQEDYIVSECVYVSLRREEIASFQSSLENIKKEFDGYLEDLESNQINRNKQLDTDVFCRPKSKLIKIITNSSNDT